MDEHGTAECPRCDWPRPIVTGARVVCGHCGLGRQAEPVEVPTDAAVLDVLSASALPVEQLRRYLDGGPAA